MGVGAGVVLCVAAVSFSVDWLTSRPIPPRVWPKLEIKGPGLVAGLKTDWDDGVRYQLLVVPRSKDLGAAFDETVRSHRDQVKFTVRLLDKAGFEICKEDVKPSPLVGEGNRMDGLEANDHFHYAACSRSDYKKADHWNLSYVFPPLTAGKPEQGSAAPAQSSAKSPKARIPRQNAPDAEPIGGGVKSPELGIPRDNPSVAEYDTFTGFDGYTNRLETLSGNTYLVRGGEHGVAFMWGVNVEVNGEAQPRLHITCAADGDCIIRNTKNGQAVHGRRVR
jgi:hypothetical protein